MSDQDILSVHGRILKMFQKDTDELPKLREKLVRLTKTKKVDYLSVKIQHSISENIQDLTDKISDITDGDYKNFYLMESGPLIREFEIILNTPIEISFMGKKVKGNKRKHIVIRDFLEIARRYTTVDFEQPVKNKKITCNNCKNKEAFDVIDYSIHICLECGSHQTVHLPTSSYKDVDRINIAGKYKYARKVHFRDCMKQYQGKQNCTIRPNVYTKLSTEFEKHHLLVDNYKDNNDRYSKIGKLHILMFLKELGLTKHYENVNLIYTVFTGKKADDISHLEDILIADFETLSDLYDKTYKHGISAITRKSFISTQYVLFQLLRRHKHPCDVNDFTILKTTDRKTFHDDIAKCLFQILGWNHTPFF